MIKYICLLITSFSIQIAHGIIQLPVPDQQDDATKIVVLDQNSLVYFDGKGLGLMSNSGQRLSAANYFSIYPLGQQMYAVQNQQEGQYALMNENGKLVTPFDYTEISPFSNQLTRVRRTSVQDDNSLHNEYAILSQNGLLISDWMDSIASTAGDDIFVVKHQNKWGIFHQNNTKYLSKNFEDIGIFNAGIAPAKLDGRWGFIENNGIWVISPAYTDAQAYTGRYAPVKLQNGQWQLIDRKGQPVLSDSYDSVKLFQDGAYGIVYQKGKSTYLGFNSRALNGELYDETGLFGEDGIAVTRKDTIHYYVNTSGEILFQADSLFEFKNGRGIFKKQSLWGWINDEAEVIAEPAFDEIIFSAGTHLVVRKGIQLLLVDVKGTTIQEIVADRNEIVLTATALLTGLHPAFYLIDLIKNQYTVLKYDEVGDISHGAIVVKKDSLYGYIDLNGKEVVAPENIAVSMATEYGWIMKKKSGDDFISYDKNLTQQFRLPAGVTFIGPFKESRAKVINQYGLMGFINEKGEQVIPCKYSLTGDFHSGRAIFRNLNGMFGYLDADGQEIIPATYKFVSDFDSKGYSAVVKDKQFGFMHLSGNIVIPFIYDNVLSLSNGIASVEKDGKTGYINMQNKKIIPFTFDEAFRHVEDLALVRMGIYWGYISGKGKVEIPWQFAEAQPFSEGKAWVKLEDKFGAINTKGAYVIPFKYEKALPFNMGYAKVQNKGKWGLVNEFGMEILPPVCDKIGEVYQQKVVVEISSNGYGIQLFK